jgi:hypothetical protein
MKHETYKQSVARVRGQLIGKTYQDLWTWAASAAAAEGHHPSGVARALALAMHANGLSYPYAGSGSVVEDLGLPRNEEVMDRELIGCIGVDSGQVMVGDPCYLTYWEDTELGANWETDVSLDGTYSYGGACKATISERGAGVLDDRRAVAVGSGGDGTFEVWVEREDGKAKRLIVEF